MGYLKLLVVENFKSWRGKQRIGPFKKFTCVIGPNGSGKSNVMDALSFVMGEKISNLRVKHIQELIYGAHVGKPVSSTGSVRMVYSEANGEEKTFSRTIRGNGSEFRINDSVVSRSVYTKELGEIGIITRARNCLVFQGEVETIAMKKPKERTQLFEQISNSGELAAEYAENKKKMQRAEEDAQFSYNKKKNVAAERKRAKLEKEEAERYQMLFEELKEKKSQLQLFQLYHNKRKIDVLNNKLSAKNKNIDAKKKDVCHAEDTVKAKKKDLGMLNRNNQYIEKEIKPLEVMLKQKRPQYIKAKERTTYQIKKVDIAKKVLGNHMKEQAKQEDNKNELQDELNDIDRAQKMFEEKIAEERLHGMRDVLLEENQINKYKELKELVRKRVAILTQQLEKLQWEQKADREKISFDQRRQKETEENIKQIREQIEDHEKRIEMLMEYSRTCTESLAEKKQEEEVLTNQIESSKRRIVEVNEELNKIVSDLHNAKIDVHEGKRQQMKAETLESLKRLYPDYVDLLKIRRKETDLKYLQAQCQGIQTRHKYSQNELDVLRKKHLANFCKEKSMLESEVVNIQSQCSMLNEGVLQRTAKIDELQKKINEVEDNIFREFCEEIGVEHIRVYEKEHIQLQEEIDKKRFEFENQKTRLNIQLEYICSFLEKEMKKNRVLEENIRKDEADIIHLKKDEENCLQMVDKIMAELQQLRRRQDDNKNEVAAAQSQVEESRKILLTLNRELATLQKEAIAIETSLEQKKLERHNRLLECKLQDLRINLLLGSFDDISEIELGPDTESSERTADIYEREHLIQIDYSNLADELKDLESNKEIETQLEQLHQEIASKEDVLLKTAAPNMKALERLHIVSDRFQESVDAFEARRREARLCRQEFEKVKKRRYELFSQCFEHVSVAIDQTYKKLCRNNSAQAFLSPENPEEPYLEGIGFNCVAPGKRFMPMDNLSGGEKSLAALALVFAIHSFRPAPFFILDEVDAALDNTNIGKVSDFIRQHSQEQFQIIVISLKEEFYSKADALIGVCPQQDDIMFSQVLTLDLTKYPDPENERRQKRKKK
ncbi:structural maintenance of chromosomes protein 1B isoform X2 [Sceloporus undulatus]|uniref:structural maintenance of chromosomes protein 1B isoform X2 n=1 Tax=Sceloporus undulatus TaxID=8520 RepID=UPI001C4BD781|nr:structural maintenance of chromosomes protein 1B isoform X2 [Sceloporus undulatus]